MSWLRKWKKTKTKYSWREIEKACKQTIDSYSGPEITRVIGLSRGGLIPATIIANHIGVRYVYSIGIASYELTSEGMAFSGKHDIYQQIPINSPGMLKEEHVLIVDDISDKGATFEHVVRTHMPSFNCSFSTMAVFVKPKTSYVPDMFYKQVDQDKWIIFPWERD